MSEAVRARKIFTAVKAFEHKVDTGLPFDEELRALKRLVDTPTESSDPSLISTVLGSVPETVASAGITSFAHLASRFTSSVAPQLRHSALLPENGGVLAYIMSYAASSFLFQKEGWAEGDDVISVIARANFWLTNKDLDLATREVNQLQGIRISYLSWFIRMVFLTFLGFVRQGGLRNWRRTGSTRPGATSKLSLRWRYLLLPWFFLPLNRH